MSKRSLAIVVITVLFCAPSLFAQCRSDDRYPNADATTFKNDLNADVSDYGVIFDEAAPWSGCTQAAADALYKKIYTTFHPPLVGQPNWPQYSNQVGWHSQYQGWLGGGDVALIHAAALRLANVGKLNKPLDDLIQRIPYVLNVDMNCGWSNFFGKDPNSCMDDYAVGAMGWAWVAAYKSLRGLGSGYGEAWNSRQAVASALSTDSSICAWDGNTNVYPAPYTGPCGGTVQNLRDGYIPISPHGGDSIPYGLGLLTSVASAAVGLGKAGYPLSLTSDEQFVIQALYNHSRPHTDGASFYSDCYRFTKDANGAMVATPNFFCGDENTRYTPTMFPVKDFIAQYAPPAASTEPSFGTFDSSLFCSTSYGYGPMGACVFYNEGRRQVYGQMAQEWIRNPPNFTNTGLSDYTVTFRTAIGTYLSARNGGGSDVNAEATSPGASEQFSLVLRNGNTSLHDGDTLTLQSLTSDQAQWVAAEGGGGAGSTLNANRLYPHEWETFTIHKLNGTGSIYSGDPVALTSVGGYYVSANNGGGSNVTVDRTAAQWWETFTISITHN